MIFGNLLARHESKYLLKTFGDTWTGQTISNSTADYIIERNEDQVLIFLEPKARGPMPNDFMIDPNVSDDQTIWVT